MSTLAEIQAVADNLQVSLDAEQQQVADLLAQKEATISALNTTVADLQVLVANGGTEAERQAVLDKLNTIKSDLEGTVAP
ncbi:MAG: hypothetical protein ACRC78_20085 [Planktothrix sp.]